MKQCFCDCCGKQTAENELLKTNINDYDVDLCYECHGHFIDEIEEAQKKVEVEFMSNMKYQPLAFKYHCE